MCRILPGIDSLKQHRQVLTTEPERYCPERCPHCGKAGLWAHGTYPRKADREGVGGESLNPVAIPRFLCPSCGATCSRLPECIAPRRWYGWAVQQAVLVLLLVGESIRWVGRQGVVSRRTVGRWWHWLQEGGGAYDFHLRSLQPQLGRAGEAVALWSMALGQRPVSAWMARLDALGVVVP